MRALPALLLALASSPAARAAALPEAVAAHARALRAPPRLGPVGLELPDGFLGARRALAELDTASLDAEQRRALSAEIEALFDETDRAFPREDRAARAARLALLRPLLERHGSERVRRDALAEERLLDSRAKAAAMMVRTWNESPDAGDREHEPLLGRFKPAAQVRLRGLIRLSRGLPAERGWDWDAPVADVSGVAGPAAARLAREAAGSADPEFRAIASALAREALAKAAEGGATPRWLAFFGFRAAALYEWAKHGGLELLPSFDPASVLSPTAFLRAYAHEPRWLKSFYDFAFLNERWDRMPLLAPVGHGTTTRFMNAARVAAPNLRLALLHPDPAPLVRRDYRAVEAYHHDALHSDIEMEHRGDPELFESFVAAAGRRLAEAGPEAAWLDDLFFTYWHEELPSARALLESAREARLQGRDEAAWTSGRTLVGEVHRARRVLEIVRGRDPGLPYQDTYEDSKRFQADRAAGRLPAEFYAAEKALLRAAWEAGAVPVDETARLAGILGRVRRGETVPLPPIAHEARYLLVPGLAWDFTPGYLQPNLARLRSLGLDAELLRTDPLAAPDRSVEVLRAAIEASDRPVVLLAHSRGSLDSIEALARRPELRGKVLAVVALQAPYRGTPVADWLAPRPRLYALGMALARLRRFWAAAPTDPKGWRAGILALTEASRAGAGAPPEGVRYYSIATSVEPRSWLRRAKALLLPFLDAAPNDGTVPTASGIVPGGRYALLDGIGHVAAVKDARFNRRAYRMSREEAGVAADLTEAAVRWVFETAVF